MLWFYSKVLYIYHFLKNNQTSGNMTEGGKAATAKAPKELLALNPEEESAFRKKVRAVKKRPKQVC